MKINKKRNGTVRVHRLPDGRVVGTERDMNLWSITINLKVIITVTLPIF